MFMDFEKRKQALANMANQLADPSFSNSLVEAYMKDTNFIKKDIYEREIKTPSFLLNEVIKETRYTKDFNIDFDYLAPSGKAAIVLPKNAINLMISKAVASSFLAGNETLVKLPRKLEHSAYWYRTLVENHLPGVKVVSPQNSSEDFLNKCIASSDIKTIVVYGDDKWIWGYKSAIRRSGKKLVFEGPGKDPQIVFPDADLNLAVQDALEGGLLNGGQSCSAIERFFVHADIETEFIDRLSEKLSLLKVGLPEMPDADLGPIDSRIVLTRLTNQVKDARDNGGVVVMGGNVLNINGTGNYTFEPTIIKNCTLNMLAFQEENFGPVFPIMRFANEEDLLDKLDDCNYGLNASLYGTCSSAVATYVQYHHRNTYFNSTVTSACNLSSRIIDGGYKNSGFIWEWDKENFLHREGKRMLLKELSAKSTNNN